MKLTRRGWSIGVSVAVLAGALALAFVPKAVPVETATVATGPLEETVDEDGRTRIKERYVVSAPLSGQLRRIGLEVGDPVVTRKTTIATLEPTPPDLLDARLRAQFEARLHAAEGQVAVAGVRCERSRTANELAQRELARASALAREKALSSQEFDRIREAALAAAEEQKSAEYGRQIATFELDQAKAALLHSTAAAQIGEHGWGMRILSPIDGRVLRVFQEDAAVVPAGARLVELGSVADLEVEIDVLSSDAVRITPGSPVRFEHWGGGEPLEGRVRMIEPAGFLKISALGVEEQRVNVIADFVSPAEKRQTLGDAYRVDARVIVWRAEQVLKVPIGALFRHEGRWAVFVADRGRAKVTQVDAGHSDGREMEILAGLAIGDTVVLHPSDKVRAGVRITTVRR